MSTIMVINNTVEDYDWWRAIFDSQKDARLEYGLVQKALYQNKAEPNKVIGIFEVEDMARLQAYMKHIQEAGIMDDAGLIDNQATPVNDVS